MDQKGTSPAIPHCPGCAKPMIVKERKPIMFSNGLVDVIYVCETCGTETTRTVKDS